MWKQQASLIVYPLNQHQTVAKKQKKYIVVKNNKQTLLSSHQTSVNTSTKCP